jgi:membrane associated rhomboid family serine protease
MIPLRDDLPSRGFPLVTILLIAVNLGVFIHQVSLGQTGGAQFVYRYGAIPALVTGAARGDLPVPPQATMLTAMFLHGGVLHVAGNMLYLWIFGDNVEDAMGRARFLVFYLLCGYAAAWGHIIVTPASEIPMIGASGAISGILGAYLVLFPRARVLTLVVFWFLVRTVRVPALLFLGFWFIMQFLMGAGGGEGGGVAYGAHVGGFLAGFILVFLFRDRSRMRWYERFA